MSNPPFSDTPVCIYWEYQCMCCLKGGLRNPVTMVVFAIGRAQRRVFWRRFSAWHGGSMCIFLLACHARGEGAVWLRGLINIVFPSVLTNPVGATLFTFSSNFQHLFDATFLTFQGTCNTRSWCCALSLSHLTCSRLLMLHSSLLPVTCNTLLMLLSSLRHATCSTLLVPRS